MSLNLSDIRNMGYIHDVIGPALGFRGTASALSGLSLTDPDNFGASYGANHFNQQYLIALPNRTGTDREKMAGRLTGSVLSLDDAVAYLGSYPNEPYEAIKGGSGPEKITLDRLNNAAQSALRSIYFDTRECLSQLFDDGSFNSPDITSWTPSSGNPGDITIEKSADPAHNLPGGLYSVLANYVTSNRYFSASTPFGAQAGDSLWIAALPILLTWGTATLQVWDVTNNRQIGQTLTVTGQGAFHLGASFGIGSAPCQVNVRLGGSAGTLIAWDCLPNHNREGLTFLPPAWVDQNWKLHGIDVYSYGRDVSQGAQRASSGQPERWMPRVDYTTAHGSEDAQPGTVSVMKSVHRSMPSNDMFYVGQRRESDRSQLLSETDTINVDFDMMEAAFLELVCEMLEARDRLGPGGTWQMLEKDYESYVAAQRVAREAPAPQPRQERRVVAI